jgi:hypothetical protein
MGAHVKIADRRKPLRFADLPDILEPKDLIEFLPIGKNAVYELLGDQKIPNLRVTPRRIVVTRAALGKYLGLDVEPHAIPQPGKETL